MTDQDPDLTGRDPDMTDAERLTEVAELEYVHDGAVGELVGDATGLDEAEAGRRADEWARQTYPGWDVS